MPNDATLRTELLEVELQVPDDLFLRSELLLLSIVARLPYPSAVIFGMLLVFSIGLGMVCAVIRILITNSTKATKKVPIEADEDAPLRKSLL